MIPTEENEHGFKPTTVSYYLDGTWGEKQRLEPKVTLKKSNRANDLSSFK